MLARAAEQSLTQEALDAAGLDWPGDYQSMTTLESGFLAAYGQSTVIKVAFAAR